MKENVLLLTITTILSFSAFGQDKPQGKFEDLIFSMTALKQQVLPLEPIPFKLTVTNNTNAPITVDTGLSFHTSAVSFEIKKPNGKTVNISQLSHLRARSFFFPKDLAPAESMDSTQIFDFKTQVYFGKVGEYQVRATYNNQEGKKVRSEWVSLTVAEPAGMDKDAYEYLRKKLDKHPQNFSPFTSWMTDELEEFVLLHPGNTYANYARYRLGERYYEREKEKAEAQFRQIQDGAFFYAREVSEKLKKLEHQLKKEN